MRLLKKLLVSLLIIVVLLILVSFFLPSTSYVERSTAIKATTATIFDLVNDLSTYDDWMPWNRIDPNMKKQYTGPISGQGASYTWQSTNKNVGNGKLTITESTPDKKVVTELDFMEHGKSTSGWTISPTDSGSNVTWFMNTSTDNLPFLTTIMSKYMFFFMDKMIGPDFEKGLSSLKHIAETRPTQTPVIQLEETAIPAQTILYVKDNAATTTQIGEKLAHIYPDELGTFIKKHNLQIIGSPMAWYNSQSPPFVFEAGCQVNQEPPKTEGRVKVRHINADRAVVAHFWGPYEQSFKAYDSIQTWLKNNNKRAKGAPYEVYIGDPGKEKNPYRVQTDIYQAVTE